MPITVTKLREKYNGLKRNNEDVNRIVVHGSGGHNDTAKGIINWMASDTNERIENYKKAIGLFPLLIDRDGTIYDILPVEDWYYASQCGQMDKHNINIELVNIEKDNKCFYTDDQYNALFKCISNLVVKFPNINTLASHDYQRRVYSALLPKPCPNNDYFAWKSVRQWLEFAGFNPAIKTLEA